jgi:NAD(P) transhydrogenase subunit alpha
VPTVFVPRERRPGEARVAATPETAGRLVKAGIAVVVEAGAGARSFVEDAAYEAAGARVVSGDAAREAALGADIQARVGPPADEEPLRSGGIVIGLLQPLRALAAVRRYISERVSAFALEMLPRTTRAQTMDALSSQASVAGYRVALLAATHLPRHFPLLMTAAGTVRPARVVVVGAGVAGLQAIATCRRLGAVVEATDVRPETKAEIESLGGRWIEVPRAEEAKGEGGYAREASPELLARQRAALADRIAAADALITTAAVPGRPAPRIVSEEMIARMRPGSVVIDLAAEQGGNCAPTRPGETVALNGVAVHGPVDVAGALAADASALYARNIQAFILHIAPKGALKVDVKDEIVDGTLICHEGGVRSAAVKARLFAEGGA